MIASSFARALRARGLVAHFAGRAARAADWSGRVSAAARAAVEVLEERRLLTAVFTSSYSVTSPPIALHDPYTIHGDFCEPDPSTGNPLGHAAGWCVAWDDSTFTTDNNGGDHRDFTHTYTEPGCYVVVVTAWNNDGLSSASPVDVEVDEYSPRAMQMVDAPVNEGSAYTVDMSSVSAADDAQLDAADNTGDDGPALPPARSAAAGHAAGKLGATPVTLPTAQHYRSVFADSPAGGGGGGGGGGSDAGGAGLARQILSGDDDDGGGGSGGGAVGPLAGAALFSDAAIGASRLGGG